MTTYAVNLSGASTQFANYGFDSFCRGPDGKYYGIKSDGLYLLEGATDDGVAIPASVGLGNHRFDSRALKAVPYAYADVASTTPMELVVTADGDSYTYPARSSSEAMKTQRFDLGKGLRENYYDIVLQNSDGGAFTLDELEVVEIKSKRRIQS